MHMNVKLSQAFDLQMGKTPSRNTAEYWGGDHKWVSIADIGSTGKYIHETKEYITDKGISDSSIKVVPKDTVIMSFKLSIGKTAITSEDMYTNEAIMAFIDKGIYSVDPNYLYHLCCGTDWTAGTNKAVMGMTLNKATLSEKMINIPSIEEQKDIADKLDAVDLLIDIQRRQLTKLDDLVKSRFVEMFGEPVTNSKGYPIHQLSDHILFLTSGSRGWAQYYTDKGEWFITIKNVKDCRISVDDVQCINPPKNAEAERTRLREGDLLISITADLGRTGVVTKEIAEHGAYNNQHLTCIRLDRLALDPLYVAFFMESEAGKRQFEAKNMSAVKAGLNFDSIRSLRLIVPPLTLQKEFAAFVSEVDKSKLAVKQSLEKLETLKKSLMQEYFG